LFHIVKIAALQHFINASNRRENTIIFQTKVMLSLWRRAKSLKNKR